MDEKIDIIEVENVAQLPIQYAYWASTREPAKAAFYFEYRFKKPAGTIYHCKGNNTNYIVQGEAIRVGR